MKKKMKILAHPLCKHSGNILLFSQNSIINCVNIFIYWSFHLHSWFSFIPLHSIKITLNNVMMNDIKLTLSIKLLQRMANWGALCKSLLHMHVILILHMHVEANAVLGLSKFLL